MDHSKEFAFPVMEVIQKRRSRRAYADTPIPEEIIKTLFEAARWAPSSVNEQPWTYIYATKDQPELYHKILDCLNEGNRVWAASAPLLIMSLARIHHTKMERTNHAAKYDLGAANAFLTLQATDLGLNVHQMGGFDAAKARTLLAIPDGYELGVIMAVGYPGDAQSLPEHLRQRELAPRERKQLDQFVMNNTF